MSRSRAILSAGLLLGILPFSAQAVVETIAARASAEVEESQDGVVVNSELAFEQLDLTTGNLPLTADARLTREESSPSSGVVSITTFTDPRISVFPDPDEFGISVAGFSLIEGISYTGSGNSTETREVTFLPDEVSAEEGDTLRARSFFFVDGVMVLWGEDTGVDMSQVSASASVVVRQRFGEEEDGNTLLTAGLQLQGQGSGQPVLTASGALAPDNVISVPVNNLVQGLGVVHLIIIPHMALPYNYNATVGEQFVLEATVSGEIETTTNAGALVLLGIDREDLKTLITDTVEGETGEQLANAVDLLLGSQLQAAKPLPESDGKTVVTVTSAPKLFNGTVLNSLCGILGIESLLGLGLLGTAMLMSGRRGRR